MIDEADRRAAEEDLGRSLAVEAGAGTGKTRLIVWRVGNLVERGEAEISRIAVITFTEKAAAELEERIRLRLTERLAELDGKDAGAFERLARAREDLERAAIQTIHAFASRLLRLRPVEAGIDPRFSVLDGEGQRRFQDETWKVFLAFSATAPDPLLRDLLEAGVSVDALRGLAIGLVENRDLLPGGAPRRIPKPDARRGAAALAQWTGEAASFARARCRDPEDRMNLAFASAARAAEAIARATPGVASRRLMAKDPPVNLSPRLGQAAHWAPADLERIRGKAADWPGEFRRFQEEMGAWVAGQASAWLAGFLEAYEARKRAESLLDFQDLLLKTRTLLRNPAVCADLRRAYSRVLVDEFQDTDPLQVEIIALLTAADGQSDWRSRRPEPGALFFVGDPKQSIYRFRRADSTIYDRARSWLESNTPGSGLTIRTNFRCRPGILSWVNRTFENLLPRLHVPLEPFRDSAGKAVLYLVPQERGSRVPGRRTAREERTLEAALIARALREGIASEAWSIQDRRAIAPRPARYGDVVLLFSAFTDVALYESALEEAGIPARASGGRRFFSRPEVSWFAALLAAIDNPHHEVAVVASLRSPWFGLTDGEILEAHGARKGRLCPLDPPASPDAAAAALAKIADWHDRRLAVPLPVIVRRLLEESGALLVSILAPGEQGRGERSVRNLLRLVDEAARHEREGGGFGSFARWLGSAAKELIPETESPDPEGEDGTVQLMTIHAAKGLEFPIVVLADLGRRVPGAGPLVVDRAAERIEYCLPSRSGAGLASAGYAEATVREDTERERERHRLLYVAATRARDFLMLPLAGEPDANSLAGHLGAAGVLPGASGDLPAELREAVAILPVPPEPLSRWARIETEGDRQAPAPALSWREASWREERRSLVTRAWGGRRFIAASRSEPHPETGGEGRGPALDSDLSEAALPRGPGAEASRSFGLAVHAVLERVDPGDAGSLAPLAAREAARLGIRSRAAEVASAVRRALALPTFSRARGFRVFREMPVSLAVGSVLLEGQIDLVVDHPEGLIVADFKTDRVADLAGARDRARGYRRQVALYALALERATGRTVQQLALLFLEPGVEVVFPFDAALRDLALEVLAPVG